MASQLAEVVSVVILSWTNATGTHLDSRTYEFPCSVVEREMEAWTDHAKAIGAHRNNEFLCFDVGKKETVI